MSKVRLGIPDPAFTAGVDLATEARKGRRRLYPVSVVYSVYALAVLVAGLLTPRPWLAVACFLGGVAFWTYVEYFAHRYVLHGIFPDDAGLWRHLLHKRFDDLHWRHHLNPWNGLNINGTFRDTLPILAPVVALAYLAPLETVPVFLAGLIQAYIVEEWVHHSVHFYRFRNRYFQYIQRHHLYHHSPRGKDIAFGLSNGIWDVVCATRIPAEDRRRLYGFRRAA